MEKLDRLGWAAGIAFTAYGLSIGVRVSDRSALARIREAVFQGSAELLFAQLVSDRRLKRSELERMRRLLAERLAEEDEQ
jgi:hypothetical protein